MIGDPHPDWQGGVGTTVTWKNLNLYFLFETYQGADIYAGTKAVLLNYGRHRDSGVETIAEKDLFDYNGGLITSGTSFRGMFTILVREMLLLQSLGTEVLVVILVEFKSNLLKMDPGQDLEK